MKVLLVSPPFYGYHSVIKSEIERQGHHCDEYLYPNGFIYVILSLFPFLKNIYNSMKDRHFRTNINKFKAAHDIVLVVKGSEISNDNHILLRQINPNAKFILYIWDDIKLDVGELNVMKYYDSVFSYNSKDCEKYSLNFRPMFYDQSIVIDNDSIKDIDLFYIASYRPDRLHFINRVIKSVKIHRTTNVIILRCSFLNFLSRIENLAFKELFKFRKVPYNEMMRLLCRSKCSIELCRPGQESLSTRSFEALYTKTKVVTTNKTIENYDFYHPSNVLIVDEFNPVIPYDWIHIPFKELDPNIMEKYSLYTFVKELIGQ